MTQPQQWKHVPGALNPADLASRGIAPEDHTALELWHQGPEFLRKPASQWPVQPKLPNVTDDDVEVKREAIVMTTAANSTPDGLEKLITSYSQWYKLLRAAIWLRRLGRWHWKKDAVTDTAVISMTELKETERALIRFVQTWAYKDERQALLENKHIRKRSSLAPLCPRLRDDLIVVGGRLQHANLSEATKHPIVLPRRHHVTKLIIRHLHLINEHAGTSHVLQALREQYWVPQGRTAVRGVISQCTHCKRLRTSTMTQQMAPLLQEQVTPNQPPFSCVGIDFFGPMLVKERRSTVKRWGCVFSCLACRAVHLEMADSMSADSFICAFERFCNRRGKPKKVYSDNGTNFVGGEREMRDALAEWNTFAIDRG